MLDAILNVESYSRKGNKPYVVFGKTYISITDDQPLKQRGIVSWYDKRFHKQRTSSVDFYDMYKMYGCASDLADSVLRPSH